MDNGQIRKKATTSLGQLLYDIGSCYNRNSGWTVLQQLACTSIRRLGLGRFLTILYAELWSVLGVSITFVNVFHIGIQPICGIHSGILTC